ncbi:hypothetical protein JCM10449v2_005400 [Rhodotorula kratochvilovae]
MDTFAYHPPGLSPSRFNPLSPSQLANPDDAHFARPGSSSGAGPSTGFTQTLPPLQEHTTGESNGAGARPTLVGFEQLTGEDPPTNGAVGGAAEQLNPYGDGADAQAVGVGFRDPFPRPSSPSQQLHDPAASTSYGAPHAHSFFNPNPNVNTRNTRPMTAPSGPSYFSGPSYSAAPSNFYTAAQQTGANAASTYDALNLPAAPVSLVPLGSSAGAPSTFQYQVDTSPHLDYEAFRARGFSLPDVGLGSGGGGESGSDPLSAGTDGASPTSSSTPFFYTPPSIPAVGAMRAHPPAPGTAPAAAYYPAVLDPSHAAAVMPVPLVASTSAILPPASDLAPPSLPPSTGTATRRASASGGVSKQYNFVQQVGQSTKRPRRRYDEIERMYNCDYPGCTKAYGTLNHLNSHKMMQKHGPKSTPAQFKEMRKAWRERKKAEAAAAARARAAQPQPPLVPPAPPPGLPNLLALPGHITSGRPRPSTSAGEYHFSMPAPFMTPLGAPLLHAYPHAPQPQPTSIAHHQASQTHLHAQGFLEQQPGPYGAAGYAPQQQQQAYDLYGGGGVSAGAMRPVTAPSYYVAPQFGAGAGGAHPLAQPPATAGSYVPQRLVSGQSAGAGTYGAAASADRRFSLPNASLGGAYGLPQPPQQQQQHYHHQQHQHQQQHTLEMPRPVVGGPGGYSALIHGGVTAAQGAPGGGADGVASLGLGTGVGGAAKLVLGGAGGAEDGVGGGGGEEVAAQ